MKFKIRKLPKSQVEIKIKISAQEFQNFIDRAISQLGQNLEVEGFRKGKAPKEILEKKIGQEEALKKAGELAIKENYLKVISENKIEALGSPEVEILPPTTFQENRLEQATDKKSGEGFAFKARVAIMPEIKLPDYKKIAASCQKRKISVEEKEVNNAVLWLQRSRAKFSQILRPAQKGDFVEVEFSSLNISEGTGQKDAFLLGQGRLIPGFEENLEGMKSGEKKNFSLLFPKEHFQKDLAGKEINFEAKVLSVQKMELPEINDEWAKSLGQFENLEALKRNITQGLNLEKETKEKQRLRQEILNKVIGETSWEIPDILIEAEKNLIIEDLKNMISQRFQISFNEYLTKINKTEEALRDSLGIEAEKRVKGSLILKEIAERENIAVNPEEVTIEMNNVLKNYPDIETAERRVDFEKLKLYIESEMRNEKTLQMLEGLTR